MSNIQVMDWQEDSKAWDTYVDASPEGTVCHLYNWRQVIQHAYGHQTFYLAATVHGTIRGVLPLVLITSRLFGRNLVSIPFMDYGGVLTEEGQSVRKMLRRRLDTRSGASGHSVLTLRNGSRTGIAALAREDDDASGPG